jgi:hypothetical protein
MDVDGVRKIDLIKKSEAFVHEIRREQRSIYSE